VLNSLLTTKLYFPPPRANLVPRPHLVDRLQTGLRGPLTLISAPAGSGKTTVLSQWRFGPGAGVSVAWLSLDPSDKGLARFLQYLAASLDALQPGLADEVRPLLQSPVQLNWEAILTLLINQLSRLESDAVLVLDDYHLIETPVIHTALTFLLDHLPSRLHLVLLTRADPPLPLTRLRACGQLIEIRGTDLRFSKDETAQFLNQVMSLGLTREQVAALERRTEGWIAGLQLAALSMHGREDLQGFISAFTGSNRYIVDYLVEEVLGRQSERLQQFLLKTSILDRFTGSICDALSGEENGERVLDELDHANLFIVPLDDEHRWFRYHHLFSDLLRRMLEKTYPGLSVDLHRRACRWYEAQMMMPEALQHAISSGDMQLVAQIVSANVLVLVENDELRPTLQKIDSLPPEKITAIPWLGIARAWVLGIGQVHNSQLILDVVEKSVKEAPDSEQRQRLTGHIAAARAFIFCATGDVPNTIAQARMANELLPQDEIAVRAMNLTRWGDVLADTLNDPSAVPILEQALALALQATKPHVAMIASAALASANQHAGRLRELHRICLEALAIAENYERRFQRPLSVTAEIYSLLSRVLLEWGEYEIAMQYARKGLILSERWGEISTETLCLCHLGRILVTCNDWEQACQVFQRAEILAQKISPWFLQGETIYILDSMLDSEAPDASEIARMISYIKEIGARPSAPLTARLLLRDNQPDQALLVLKQALAELKGQPSYDTARLHALRGLAFQARGDKNKALASLQQALELAEPENRVATFVREGAAMEKLLRQARTATGTPEFARRLLAAFESRRKKISKSHLMSKALVEQLSEREQDVLRLLAQGCADKKIAETLVIARETVHKHLKNIYGKLEVHSRTEAISRAHELGLL
jgi:LuxR family maltose regulon positive regulatory protein